MIEQQKKPFKPELSRQVDFIRRQNTCANMYKGKQTNCFNSSSNSKPFASYTSCLSIVFHRVKRQCRLGLSVSARCMKFATTCVDLIKIRLCNFICETGSNPQIALDFSNPGCSLVLLLKSHKSCHDDG